LHAKVGADLSTRNCRRDNVLRAFFGAILTRAHLTARYSRRDFDARAFVGAPSKKYNENEFFSFL
jgi:hypothetical protein